MSKKILVVDDEAHVRLLLEQTLEELEDDFGVRILAASDGQEALDVIVHEFPDLVFLDVMMPRMNGYQVCEAVASNPDLQGITIVLLTAKGQEADRRQGLETGAFRYMTKPFDPDELLDLSKVLLGLA
ncbi:MAG: response regulator [Deltaproteobacteria bacterium]|nr:response regulator [Deltaproteobacteria bacterium]